MNIDDDDDLVTTKRAAVILKLSKRTLEKWRLNKNKKVPFVNIEGLIRYSKTDLAKYIKVNTKRV